MILEKPCFLPSYSHVKCRIRLCIHTTQLLFFVVYKKNYEKKKHEFTKSTQALHLMIVPLFKPTFLRAQSTKISYSQLNMVKAWMLLFDWKIKRLPARHKWYVTQFGSEDFYQIHPTHTEKLDAEIRENDEPKTGTITLF